MLKINLILLLLIVSPAIYANEIIEETPKNKLENTIELEIRMTNNQKMAAAVENLRQQLEQNLNNIWAQFRKQGDEDESYNIEFTFKPSKKISSFNHLMPINKKSAAHFVITHRMELISTSLSQVKIADESHFPIDWAIHVSFNVKFNTDKVVVSEVDASSLRYSPPSANPTAISASSKHTFEQADRQPNIRIAYYLQKVAEEIEEIANQNFPASMQYQPIEGAVFVDVKRNKVYARKVEVSKSSGIESLDKGALRLMEMMQPFNLEYDALDVWKFTNATFKLTFNKNATLNVQFVKAYIDIDEENKKWGVPSYLRTRFFNGCQQDNVYGAYIEIFCQKIKQQALALSDQSLNHEVTSNSQLYVVISADGSIKNVSIQDEEQPTDFDRFMKQTASSMSSYLAFPDELRSVADTIVISTNWALSKHD